MTYILHTKKRQNEIYKLAKQRESRNINGAPKPITEQEIITCLKHLKNIKARGPDDIKIESLKALGDDGMPFLTNLYNKILGKEEIPQKWKQSYLVPIFKNKGDPNNCQNYRGTNLMLRYIIEIGETQFGFMPGRSTTDAIHAIRQMSEKYREKNKKLHTDMYMIHTTIVRSTTGTSSGFTIVEGHQESALSPLLFITVIDVLLQSIPQTVLWNMIFADDIVILAESKHEMKES
ncbi:uncharacterized protein LOC135928563 [Gordionus sp. m RMFG-2023]|uniref:uncharacterized protein LOC135928563 n=1 Tax=Gordionus sp. m RMFG-2023 TaxID=3053472 RepID=UPI0031FBBE3F